MLDGVTLDQLRTFLAAVDAGSFSAAGRRLGRAQSVVSQTLATMEDRLQMRLFDRSGRYPVLTPQGRDLAVEARVVVGAMARFKGRAAQMAAGLEPEVAVTIDVMVPFAVVTNAVKAFETQFPDVALRLSIETLGAVLRPILTGADVFAIAGPLAEERSELMAEPFPGVAMVAVAAPSHPAAGGGFSLRDLATHRQLVLSDRSDISRGRDFGVFTQRTWRLSDLGSKHALLRAGLGWGGMPRDLVEDDLATGRLVQLDIDGIDPAWATMPMHVVHHAERPPGIAARWLIERLRQEAATRA